MFVRELFLVEIREIRENIFESFEFEVFVYGVVCILYLGRCFLSVYMIYRDVNRGECVYLCRYKYYVMEEKRLG